LLACLVALAGVAAPALRPGEATMGIIRGAACAYVMVTMIGYRFLIGGDYSLPASLLEHLAVPIQAPTSARRNPRWRCARHQCVATRETSSGH